MVPVIICGGFGTKLWPISRQHKPKHFLKLIRGKSLFEHNYEALRTKFKPEEIFVSTNEDQAALAQKQIPDIPTENYILEPEMRNQGPATGLIAATLHKKGFENEPFMIIQVDVVREPVEGFIKMMTTCDSIARRETKYITGGFRPEYSVMGVDYLVKRERVSSSEEVGVFEIAEYVWRGSKEQTEEFVKRDDALVHANHTCMTPRNFLNMIGKYKTEWYEPLMNIVNGGNVKSEFVKMPTGPLEDVTQEVYKAGEALVVELPFKWTDFGTYESLFKYLKTNEQYKAPDNVIQIDSEDNFVKLDDSNKVIAVVGASNLVIVDTGDVLLICDTNHTGQVGEARKEAIKRKMSLT